MIVLDALEFGPFATEYHQHLVTDSFKAEVRRFVVDYLVPQVDHDIVEIDGTFVPRAKDDENCGPNSAIRNCFYLDLRFFGLDDSDYSQIETQLWYRPLVRSFQVAHGSSLFVWTPRRRQGRVAQKTSIHLLVDSILKHSVKSPRCPICNARLSVIDTANHFRVRCPTRCFQYSRDMDDRGVLISGHEFYDLPDPCSET